MKKLIKISDDEFYIGGTFKYTKKIIDNITVKDKTYTHTEYVEQLFDLDESFKNKGDTICRGSDEDKSYLSKDWNWFRTELKCLTPFIGKTIKVWENNEFYGDFFKDAVRVDYSTNDYAQKLLWFINDSGIISKEKIKNAFVDKLHWQYETIKHKESTLYLPIFGYGFNNFVIIEVPFKSFIKIPFSSHSNLVKNTIKKFYQDILIKDYFESNLTDETYYKSAMQFFKKQISFTPIKNKQK